MQREEIVAGFFKKGHLLTEDAIRLLEEQSAESAIHEMPTGLPLVVEPTDLRTPFKILKNLTYKKAEITSEDFVKFYNSKYEKMKKIILSRVPKDFMSLNKIDSTRSEVHVLGIIKEIKEKDGKKIIDIEDPTGNVPVIFEPDAVDSDFELDDVVAIRAIAGGSVLFGKKIIYPDVPLRTPATGAGKACFVSDFRLDEASTKDAERFFQWFSQMDAPYLLVAGDLGDKELFEKYVERYCYAKTVFVIASDDKTYPQTPLSFRSSRIVSLSNPAMLELGGLKILMVHKGNVSFLKKRYLGRPSAILEEDYLVLDEVPDIMHTGHGEPHIINYKSTTIINSGSLLGTFTPVVVDFATREVEKVNLN